MAKKTPVAQPTEPQQPEERLQKESYSQFPLVKINFILMAVSAAMIILGFILIAGGGSETGEFNPEVFSATRIVVGPTLAFLGFVAMGAAIMWTGKKQKSDKDE